MKRSVTLVVLLPLLFCLLGCTGLMLRMAHGPPLAKVDVTGGQPFELIVVSDGQPTELKLMYGIRTQRAKGGDFDVDVTVKAKGGLDEHVRKTIGPDNRGRGAGETGSRTAADLVVKLPAVPAGTKIKIRGTATPCDGIQVVTATVLLVHPPR